MSSARDPDSEIRSLWYTRCAVPTASSLAFQQGWLQQSFANIDIALASVRAAEDLAVRDSHYTNSLRNQFREGGNVPAIWAKSTGAPTAVVGITWVEEFQAIVSSRSSGLSRVEQLRGRKLGLPRHESPLVDHGRASALHGFVSTLKAAGIDEEEVSFIDIDVARLDIREDAETGVLSDRKRPPSLLDALDSGVVDAIYVKGPNGIRQVRERGLKIVFEISAHWDPLIRVNNAVPRPITADRERVIRDPDLVARYLVVLLETGRWASKHPAETLRLVAHETGSSEGDAAQAYGYALHRQLVPTLEADVVAGLEEQKRFLHQRGFLAKDFDFRAWIEPEPLALARKQLGAEPAASRAFEPAL